MRWKKRTLQGRWWSKGLEITYLGDTTTDSDEEKENLLTSRSKMDKEEEKLATPRLKMGSNDVNNTLREIGFAQSI